MHAVDEVIFVSAPLRRDEETTRWYSEGASSCVVLTRRGRLLEPCPVFGPTSYRYSHGESGRRKPALTRSRMTCRTNGCCRNLARRTRAGDELSARGVRKS